MNPSEFIKLLNKDSNRRELFRADPVGLVSQADMMIGDILIVVGEAFKNLQNMSMRDMEACLRLLQYIEKNGPEITRRAKEQGS
jgi:hypothetical protein